MADVPAPAALPAAESAASAVSAGSTPPSGPGFTEVAVPPTLPDLGPESPPRNEWSEWYEPSESRRRYDQLPAYQQSAYQPPAYQPPAYRQSAYQPPSPYQQPPVPYPGGQPPYRSPFEPGRPGGRGDRDRQSRAPLLWLVASAVVAIAVVAFVLILRPFSHPADTLSDAANSTTTARPTVSAAAARTPAAKASAAAKTSPAASASATGSASAGSAAERQAASTVAAMLASSGADRTAIDGAYDDVDRCGPNLNGDAAVFDHAVSSRRALLASLGGLPGRSALPPALLTDLAQAWQASIAADQGLATWAADEVSQGCQANDTSDPGYRASLAPDNQATAAKIAFVAQWNPIAESFGLPTYQSSQL